ncbi:hypothetical protein HAHE_31560 [Haloferula helveola]|uniref:Uncharacterized protein n=1 Tax=Haloferula helveola TaxID=490095 RepID=A0ABN6H6W9_9BACT|nr:hypothetical protein HAHE_31560 [Haloferula helveola]
MKHMHLTNRSLSQTATGHGSLPAITPIAIAMLGFSATVNAANITWDGGGANQFWATPENWGGDVVPVDGDAANVNGGAKGVSPIPATAIADLNGVSVSLPNSQVSMYKGSEGGSRIEDNVGGATLTCDIFHVQQGGRPAYEVDVPIIANTEVRTRYRLGGVKFFQSITTPEVDLGRGDVYLYGDVNATTEFKVVRDDANTNAYLEPHPTTAAVPTLTTPSVLLDDGSSKFFADGIVSATTITIQNAAQYFVERDGALGDGTTTVNIDSGGYLDIQVPQTTLPGLINVGAFAALAGDLTGATYGGGGNVAFAADAVFAPSAGPSPARADIGGATIYQGVLSGSKVLTVGDDGATAIYKGAAIGPWYGTVAGMELTAETGSGDLQLVFGSAGTFNVDQNNKFFGDGTSTTADIVVLNGALFRNRYTLNGDYAYDGSEPTRIDTFNIQGEVGNEAAWIMDHWSSPRTHILEGQTWNISNGSWRPVDDFAGRGQHGTVNLSNGRMIRCETAFAAGTDTVSLNFSGLHNIQISNSNLEFLEALDGAPGNGSFSYSGMPVVSLDDDLVYAFDYSGATTYPILADLLQNADIAVDGPVEVNIDSDLRIGHEKYFIWSWSSSYSANANSIDSGNGSKLVPAGNAPPGETDVLGIAPNPPSGYRPNKVNVEVSAPGAIVRVGSDDPDRIPSLHTGALETSLQTGEVEFYQAITADLLELRSGTTRMMVDQTLPAIDVGADTRLLPNGNTITVTGTLSGSGDIDNGGTVVVGGVAPGASAGTLGDGSGSITLEDGATFELEVADPAAGFGTGYDTIYVNTFESLGALTIDLAAIDGLTPAESNLTDIYVIANAATYTGDFTLVGTGGTVTVTGTGWDTSAATLTFNGADLELSGVEYTGGTVADPFDTWATSGTVGGVTFEGDANGDGVDDGIAFLLGAATPDEDANGLLPTPTEDGSGGLVMTFTMLKPSEGAPAVLSLGHSSDLGVGDAWTSVDVPAATGTVGGVDFTVTENAGDSTKNDVVATIPAAGNAINGALFGRLTGAE